MDSLHVQSIQAQIGGERWPDNVRLYQQYQVEQITFPDYAACLSVKAFLHMCGLNFTTVLKVNAAEMSPSGRVPFIQMGPFLVSEVEPIVACVQTRGFQLSSDLSEMQLSEMKAYMTLVMKTLVNAELYLAWIDKTTADQVTKPRYGAMYPWPLNKLLPLQQQWSMKKRLSHNGWAEKSLAEVSEEVNTCCQALSERLDKQEYFFGQRPTELDAVVFGHLFTLLTTALPQDTNSFAKTIQRYSNLVDFCERIDQQYFKALNNDY